MNAHNAARFTAQRKTDSLTHGAWRCALLPWLSMSLCACASSGLCTRTRAACTRVSRAREPHRHRECTERVGSPWASRWARCARVRPMTTPLALRRCAVAARACWKACCKAALSWTRARAGATRPESQYRPLHPELITSGRARGGGPRARVRPTSLPHSGTELPAAFRPAIWPCDSLETLCPRMGAHVSVQLAPPCTHRRRDGASEEEAAVR